MASLVLVVPALLFGLVVGGLIVAFVIRPVLPPTDTDEQLAKLRSAVDELTAAARTAGRAADRIEKRYS